MAQSLIWRFFPAGVSSPQVTESASTGFVQLPKDSLSVFHVAPFLGAPQERCRGPVAGSPPAVPGAAAAALCPTGGAGPPPPPATLIGVFVYTSGTRGGGAAPPLARPGDVTGGGTGPLLARPGGVGGVRGGRAGTAPDGSAEIAGPRSCRRDSPRDLRW